MTKFYAVPHTGEPSSVEFDGLQYELTNDDWRSQAIRQHDSRWQHARSAAARISRSVSSRYRSVR